LHVSKFLLNEIGNNGIPRPKLYGNEDPYEYCNKFKLDPQDMKELNDYYSLFSPMKEETISFFKDSLILVGRQERLKEALQGPCPIGCLAQYKGRGDCIRVVKRWLYQLWVLKLVIEALKIDKLCKRPYEEKPRIEILQGSPTPAVLGRSALGYDVTIWFEFQPTEDIHLVLPLARRKRTSVRPDIVITKGLVQDYNYTSRLLDVIRNRSIIIECKEDPYNKWGRSIRNQLSDYRDLYAPKRIIIASLRLTQDIQIADKTFQTFRHLMGR